MALDTKTVAKIAQLARIKVDEAALEPLAGELSRILSWVDQLNEVDTEGVRPMTSVVEMELRHRQDAVRDGGQAEAVLSNAPESTQDYFVVPKTVE